MQQLSGAIDVIVFINGPFGVGKTTLANVLVEKLPNAMIFDPEEVGYFLRQVLGPLASAEDFQDLSLWRSLTVEIISRVREEYGRDLIIPMTIFRRHYFDEIADGLRAIEPKLIVVQLVASRETFLQRIETSDEGRFWRMKHLDTFASETPDPVFGVPISTDDRTPEDIADNILALVDQRHIELTR